MVTTYIIPAGNLVAVKAKLQQAKDEGLVGLPGMFTTPLSATGTGNATHYCSSGIMSAEEEEWLEANLPKSAQRDAGDGGREAVGMAFGSAGARCAALIGGSVARPQQQRLECRVLALPGLQGGLQVCRIASTSRQRGE